MSVKVRPYRQGSGGWHVDVRFMLPNGRPFRQRTRMDTTSKSAALRWGQARERHLLLEGVPQRRKEVPTLEQFAGRFIENYARANQQKPSGIAAKETILKVHLMPWAGTKRLDQITNADVQHLKGHLHDRAPKTVNNVLTVLNVMLKMAVEWAVIDRVLCAIRLLPTPIGAAQFLDFDEYERFVNAARTDDPNRI